MSVIPNNRPFFVKHMSRASPLMNVFHGHYKEVQYFKFLLFDFKYFKINETNFNQLLLSDSNGPKLF